MSLRLEDDAMCYVCGRDNVKGFRLSFEHPEKGVLRAAVTFSKEHQGFRGIVHGGMLAMLLDEMMVNLAWKEGYPAVTAELNVRLKQAAKVGEPIYFEGRLSEIDKKGRLLKASSRARDGRGQLLAEATATCLCIKQD